MPHNAITTIMNGDRAVSAQMAIRLAKALGTTPRYWLNLQSMYDLKKAHAKLPPQAHTITRFEMA